MLKIYRKEVEQLNDQQEGSRIEVVMEVEGVEELKGLLHDLQTKIEEVIALSDAITSSKLTISFRKRY